MVYFFEGTALLQNRIRVDHKSHSVAFDQSVESLYYVKLRTIIKQDFSQTLENTFFIDAKGQSKIEVILINRIKFIILFKWEENVTYFSAVASLTTTTVSNLK